MNADIDRRIAAQLAAHAPSFAADWDAVERRARAIRRLRALRRGGIVVLTALVGVLLVTPAGARLGESLGLLDGNGRPPSLRSGLGTVQPPPPEVVEQLTQQDFDRPPNMPEMAPRVAETRTLLTAPTPQGELVLRVTPAKNGQACMSAGVRGARREQPRTSGCYPDKPVQGVEVNTIFGDGFGRYGMVMGRVTTNATRVELVFANGGRQPARVQNGWFVALVESPRLMLFGADVPAEVVAFDGAGAELARSQNLPSSLPAFMPERPPIADVRRERRVQVVGGEDGGPSAEMFLSPTRPGSTPDWCARLALDGRHLAWQCAGLPPSSPAVWAGLAPIEVDGRRALFVSGVVAEGLAAELRYQDGFHQPVALHERMFLAAVPPERLQPGRRLLEVVAVRPDGEVAGTLPISTRDRPLYTESTPSAPPSQTVGVPLPDGPATETLELVTASGGLFEWRMWRDQPRAGHTTHAWSYRGRILGAESQGREIPGTPNPVLSFGYMPVLSDDGSDDVFLLTGSADPPTRSVRMRFRDGTTERVLFEHGRILLELTEARRARHPVRIEAIDAHGRVIGQEPVEEGAF